MSKIEHQITLIAYRKEGDAFSIMDIIETNYRNASFFARGFIRNSEITHMAAYPPGRLGELPARRKVLAQ